MQAEAAPLLDARSPPDYRAGAGAAAAAAATMMEDVAAHEARVARGGRMLHLSERAALAMATPLPQRRLEAFSSEYSPDGDVWFRGAARDVVLSSSGLDIIADPVVHIPLTELLSVRAGQVFRPPFCYSLVLKVVGRSRRRRKACNWFVQTLELRFRHNDICQHWITAIQGFMDADLARPRRLLAIINPFSGKRIGVKIFNKVLPHFEDAGILVVPHITTRPREPLTLLSEIDLSFYDGVLAVGGDGTANEVIEGLMRIPPDARPRLGIIPAGSENALVASCHGSYDLITCVLHIIVGDTHGLDVAELTIPGRDTPRHAGNFVGYGFLGDVQTEAEKHRWMGPSRYGFSGFLRFLKNKSYSGEITFRPPKLDLESSMVHFKCAAGCTRCKPALPPLSSASRASLGIAGASTSESSTDSDDEAVEWSQIKGSFACVNIALVTLQCSKSKHGMAPYAHMADGIMTLVLVRRVGRIGFLRFLLRLASKENANSLPHVEVHECTELRYRPSGTERELSAWNVDGEINPEPELLVKCLPSALQMFSRGVERTPFERAPLFRTSSTSDDAPATDNAARSAGTGL